LQLPLHFTGSDDTPGFPKAADNFFKQAVSNITQGFQSPCHNQTSIPVPSGINTGNFKRLICPDHIGHQLPQIKHSLSGINVIIATNMQTARNKAQNK
jgi:hypothetical protein